MSFWKRPFPWIYQCRTRLIISSVLFIGVVFIIVFIKPFDLGEKALSNKNLILSGFGFCVLLADLILLLIERYAVLHKKKQWTISLEVGYFLGLLSLVACFNFIYDKMILKGENPDFSNLPSYLLEFTLPFACVFFPLIAYFRYQYGTVVHPEELSQKPISLLGQNKGEKLEILKQQIAYVQAEDNYIRVFYFHENGTLSNQLMRNTLVNCAQQVPELLKCHRSYLIAPWRIQKIKGSKHKATLLLDGIDVQIPLSATYYERIAPLS